MADEADNAQEVEELALRMALSRRIPNAQLPPKGFCYNCNTPLKAERSKDGTLVHKLIFCDKACADDYELEQRAKSRRRL